MKHKDNNDDFYDDEDKPRRLPDDGREEIDIEPLDWDDM